MNRLEIYQQAAERERSKRAAADLAARRQVGLFDLVAPVASRGGWCCVPNQDRPGIHGPSCKHYGRALKRTSSTLELF